jgi:DNA processing protein
MNITSEAMAALCLKRHSAKEKKVLLQRFGSFANVVKEAPSLLKEAPLSVIKEAENDLKEWAQAGLKWCIAGEEDFPAQFFCLEQVPLIIFYQGRTPGKIASDRSVAIVGSRSATAEACDFTYQIADTVVRHNGIVISGLALGIDRAAHQGAVEAYRSSGQVEHSTVKHSTVAILGGGHLRLYPANNRSLADGILSNGGTIISQFEPREAPLPHQFLMRNQLIASFGVATLVVAAAARSGALNTASSALALGKEVLAVPGSVFDPRMAGCNLLIQQGAHVLLKSSEILQFFKSIPDASQNAVIACGYDVNSVERQIIQFIGSEGGVSHAKVVDKFGCEACSLITKLELEGFLGSLPGGMLVVRKL